MVGRAAGREGRAVEGLFEALENQRADALGGFLDFGFFEAKDFFRIPRGELFAQAQAAQGNFADAAPLAVGDFEHNAEQVLRRNVAGAGDGARVLIFQLRAALFELGGEHSDGFEKIGWLEATDHDGDMEIVHQRFIFAAAHDGANVAGRDEALYAVDRGVENQADGRRDQNM